jgi:hypothetical protein
MSHDKKVISGLYHKSTRIKLKTAINSLTNRINFGILPRVKKIPLQVVIFYEAE